MSGTPSAMESGQTFARVALVVALAGVALTWLVFSLLPGLDLAASGQFHTTGKGFAHGYRDVTGILRRIVMTGFTVFYIVAVLALIHGWRTGSTVFGLGKTQWLYVAACQIAGPLLVANVLLKENWGRARPRQVEAFGGDKLFTPFWEWTDQCAANCSFVSGEASAAVMVFIPLAFVATAGWRWGFVGLSLLALAVSGGLRMVVGGHFLSDTVMAGFLMLLTAAILYRLIRPEPSGG